MKMKLYNKQTQQQQTQQQQTPPPVHYETSRYRLGFISSRKCASLIVQGNKSCSSCSGKK